METESAAFDLRFLQKGARTHKKTTSTPGLYINTSYQIALKSKLAFSTHRDAKRPHVKSTKKSNASLKVTWRVIVALHKKDTSKS